MRIVRLCHIMTHSQGTFSVTETQNIGWNANYGFSKVFILISDKYLQPAYLKEISERKDEDGGESCGIYLFMEVTRNIFGQ